MNLLWYLNRDVGWSTAHSLTAVSRRHVNSRSSIMARIHSAISATTVITIIAANTPLEIERALRGRDQQSHALARAQKFADDGADQREAEDVSGAGIPGDRFSNRPNFGFPFQLDIWNLYKRVL